jgi:hypothetical protein
MGRGLPLTGSNWRMLIETGTWTFAIRCSCACFRKGSVSVSSCCSRAAALVCRLGLAARLGHQRACQRVKAGLSACQRAQAGACFGLSAAACRTGFLLAARSSWLAAPGGLAASVAFSSAGFMLQARHCHSRHMHAFVRGVCSMGFMLQARLCHSRHTHAFGRGVCSMGSTRWPARPAELCRARGCDNMSVLRGLQLTARPLLTA